MIGNNLVWIGECDSATNECGCGETNVEASSEELLAFAEIYPEDLIITCEPTSGIFYTILNEGKYYCEYFVILFTKLILISVSLAFVWNYIVFRDLLTFELLASYFSKRSILFWA